MELSEEFVTKLVDACESKNFHKLHKMVSCEIQVVHIDDSEYDYTMKLGSCTVDLLADDLNATPGLTPMSDEEFRQYVVNNSTKQFTFSFLCSKTIQLPTSPYYGFKIAVGNYIMEEPKKYHMFEADSTRQNALAIFYNNKPGQDMSATLSFDIHPTGYTLASLVVKLVIPS